MTKLCGSERTLLHRLSKLVDLGFGPVGTAMRDESVLRRCELIEWLRPERRRLIASSELQ